MDTPAAGNEGRANVVRTAKLLMILAVLAALIPVAGSLIAGILTFVIFILSFVILAKGKTGAGLLVLFGSFAIGIWIWVALAIEASLGIGALAYFQQHQAQAADAQESRDASANAVDQVALFGDSRMCFLGRTISECDAVLHPLGSPGTNLRGYNNFAKLWCVSNGPVIRVVWDSDKGGEPAYHVEISTKSNSIPSDFQNVLLNTYSQGQTWDANSYSKNGWLCWRRSDGVIARIRGGVFDVFSRDDDQDPSRGLRPATP